MKVWSRIGSTCRNLFWKRGVESQLDEEVRAYVDIVADEKIAAGMSAEEARRTALVEFGGIEQVKQSVREQRAGAGIEYLWMDLRWAVRGIKRAPGSAVAMVLLLALGMGGVTALFGPLYSLVLRPLPFSHSEQLVHVNATALVFDLYSNPTHFKNRRSYDPIFSDFMAYWVGKNTLSGSGPAEQIDVATVTQEFFSTLGVQPRLGGGFPVDHKVSSNYDPNDVPSCRQRPTLENAPAEYTESKQLFHHSRWRPPGRYRRDAAEL
jgi:hypothetical protein